MIEPTSRTRETRERVWDAPVRILHWSLVAAIATAWFSGEEHLTRHEWAGYAAVGIAALRTAWGFIGSRHARFGDFVRSPGAVWRYAVFIGQRREPRYLGHNPLGGWMIVLLLITVLGVGVTGWLYTLDAFWGLAWLEWLHRAMAWSLVVLITLHVGGVVFSSLRHRENLVGAMVTGWKRR